MRKRFLVGLLSASLLIQSVSLSALAAPADNPGATGTVAELSTEQTEGSQPGAEDAKKTEDDPVDPEEGNRKPGTDGGTGSTEEKKENPDDAESTSGSGGNTSASGTPEGGENTSGGGTPEGGENISGGGASGDGADTSDADKPGDGGDGSDGQTPGEEEKPEQDPVAGDKTEQDPGADDGTDAGTSKPGTEKPDLEETGSDGESVTDEDASLGASYYNVQVSGNDISGNDLRQYEEKLEIPFVGGYNELPEERNISVVDESLLVDYYGDGIAPLAEENLPEEYIPRKGTLPLTRNQGEYGSCWAHSAMALAEIDMIKNGGKDTSVNYSEHHLAYFSYNYNNETVRDPLGGLDGDSNGCVYTEKEPNYMQRGGNLIYAQNVLTSWVGAAEEVTLPYPTDDSQLITQISDDLKKSAFADAVHLQNCYRINLKGNPEIVKQMILKYGAVGTSYYEDNSYFDKGNASYYCYDKNETNHAVTIVGWDDKFSAFDGLENKPKKPGAWLIRNSWDEDKDENSRGRMTYFWLSYEDTSLSGGFAFDFESSDNYQHNYQYDGSMGEATVNFKCSQVRTANVFTAKGCEKGEQLKAVGICVQQAQTRYTIYVYKNPNLGAQDMGTLVSQKSGQNYCAGFYTVFLDKPVDFEKGDTFAVVVELEKPSGIVEIPCEATITEEISPWLRCTAIAKPGQSFCASYNEEYKQWSRWTDFGGGNHANFRIKAYTVDLDGEPESSCEVTFDMRGLGENQISSVEKGSKLDKPADDPTAVGYLFKGWYKDEACTDPWDFENDTVTGNLTLYAKWEKEIVSLEGEGVSVTVTVPAKGFTYNGEEQTPKIVVTVPGSSTPLVEKKDYTLSYENNINASTDTAKAKVMVTGIGDYSGTVEKTFEIKKAPLKITVTNREIQAGDSIPTEYEYKTEGLKADDTVTSLSFRTVERSETAGTEYDIVPYDAKIGNTGEDNYEITYVKGTLTIQEKPVDTYDITFDMQGHGTALVYENIPAGNTIKKPANPSVTGYHFEGWYKDKECNIAWNFDTDTVTENLTLYAKWTQMIQEENVSLVGTDFTYNGNAQTPEVVVKVSDNSEPLVKNTDYDLSYKDNKNAGTATVTVTGKGDYSGTVEKTFKIEKAPLTIKAKDITIQVGDPVPGQSDYLYEKKGLMAGDSLTKEPSFSCGITSTDQEGTYEIMPSGADAGENYDISYEKGTLTVVDTSVYYAVTFNMKEHGTAPTGYDKIKAGSTLAKPVDPTAKGYHFKGWYKDEACTDLWDFENDTVTENLTLYAKWEKEIVSLEGEGVSVTVTVPEKGFTYNGEERTPKVVVKVSGIAEPLVENTDYTLSYENNTNAGKAMVTVTGKGDYSGTVVKDFNIKKAPLTITAESITIRVDDELPEKYKYVVSGLIGSDELVTEPTCTCDIKSTATAGEYPIVPCGAVAGKNYEIIAYENGTLTVVDEYVYYKVTFDINGHGDTAPAALEHVRQGKTISEPEAPTADGYVFCGWYREAACRTPWNFKTDTVTGNLTLYAKWQKEIVSLTGAAVTVIPPDGGFIYNGKAQTPKVVVRVSDSSALLVENTDYTLSYENNTNAGTATVTVTGKGGYKDTVSKTFVIKPAPVTVWAKDKTILVGDPVPTEYEFGIDGLLSGDSLITPPSRSCDIVDTTEEKNYTINISGADAGSNYIISYRDGTLRVVKAYTFYKVTFDVQGHGTAPADYENVKIGSTIARPADPTAEEYSFGGWYQDEDCTTAWNFDRDTVQADLTLYAKWIRETVAIEDDDVVLEEELFTYDGTNHRPKVTVTVSGVTLVEGQDYKLSYKNSKDAGIATVYVFGIGGYSGTVEKYYRIEALPLVIKAKDMAILLGDPIPAGSAFAYEVTGLAEGDVLTKEPSFSCAIESSEVAGQYDIVPYGAEAGKNYSITYEAGILTVAEEYVSCTVTFDVRGHGTDSVSYIGIKIGSTINRPTDPVAEGYRFEGWYRDTACTKAWDFENDIVQEDLTLYAKWLQLAANGDESGFAVQEIADVYYTGKQCKPAVSVYDGGTLLKAGRDYQIKYYNNINANANGVQKTGNGAGSYFNSSLPYVEITGKGNYAETVKVNFNILRASIGDGGESPAAGVSLKVKDQLVTAAKGTLKPFTSIKYKKAMRQNTDYTVSLTAVSASDGAGNSVTGELSGAVIPAGYSGKFLLTVAGAGNYGGSIGKTIYVADKAHLIKNATVTLGKNQKNVTFAGKAVELNASEVNSADTFTVKYGKTFLKPEQDYTVGYRNNDRVGKAELIITGAGEYAGSKTVTFHIKGVPFSAKTVNVNGIENKVYTGRAWTQNDAVLTYTAGAAANQPLVYGKDYTINYSRNVNKGTATMTFKGVDQAGYSGSFKKTFQIAAADINRVSRAEGMKEIAVEYCKAGAKPVEEIALTDQSGYILKNGRDYTLRYANNKAVANITDAKPPTVIVKGKGNYKGEFSIPFRIVKADLRGVTVKTTPVPYKSNKAAGFAYKPAVKLLDGKSALRAGRDYEIEYRNNTQADYEKYMQGKENTAEAGTPSADSGVPMAVITGKADSSYYLEEPIVVPLPIYQKKFKKAELTVEIGETLYTGGQVTPTVKVYYGGGLLAEGRDYTLSYGTNIKSGRSRGKVTISGIAPKYGGSVTVKFDITRKPIAY